VYSFTSPRVKEIMLTRNFQRVNSEVDAIISELLGRS